MLWVYWNMQVGLSEVTMSNSVPYCHNDQPQNLHVEFGHTQHTGSLREKKIGRQEPFLWNHEINGNYTHTVPVGP